MTNIDTQPPAENVADLAAQVAFTMSDASRLLRKQDVQGACPHPNDCFYETDRVRCGPCAVKASAYKGVEIDDTHSHLPEVCRLRREVRAAAARIAELESTASAATNMPGLEDAFNALGVELEKLPSSSEQTQLSTMLQSFKRRAIRYQNGEPSLKLHFTNEELKEAILNSPDGDVEIGTFSRTALISRGGPDTIALEAVEAIFADLRGRRFFKWIFDRDGETTNFVMTSGEPIHDLDLKVQRQIKAAWQAIIARAISAETNP